jgi:hypothetical protein
MAIEQVVATLLHEDERSPLDATAQWLDIGAADDVISAFSASEVGRR